MKVFHITAQVHESLGALNLINDAAILLYDLCESSRASTPVSSTLFWNIMAICWAFSCSDWIQECLKKNTSVCTKPRRYYEGSYHLHLPAPPKKKNHCPAKSITKMWPQSINFRNMVEKECQCHKVVDISITLFSPNQMHWKVWSHLKSLCWSICLAEEPLVLHSLSHLKSWLSQASMGSLINTPRLAR